MLALARIGNAGGAPIGDLMWAGAVGTALSLVALWVFSAHRAGRISWLRRLADWSGAQSGLPGWASVPLAVSGASLLTAGFGFYWDVAKHIDTGRDAGPFGTPAHWPILIGLAGITLAGLLAIVIGTDGDEVPTSVRISEGWHAPLGGLLIFMCGGLALVGFPLDDVWHTLFGQDVTLWGPTHILMVGGASLSALGTWVLLVEGRRCAQPAASRLLAGFIGRSEFAIAGAFLIGMSTLQGEFDYGVPQFQLVYQPVMIAFAAGLVLVAARIRLGRGAALFAAVFHSVAFGLASLAIHQGFGLSTLHFPLYLAEAAIVEAVALLPLFDPRKHALGFGLGSGLLLGTAGVAAEWGWSHVWMPLPWTASMLGQTAALAPAAGLAGGVIGAYCGNALSARDRPGTLGAGAGTGRRIVNGPRWALPLAGAAIVFCIAYPLPMNAGPAANVSASLTHVLRDGRPAVQGTFTLTPRDAADNAEWVTAMSWQGGGLVVNQLRRVSEGVYATTEAIPASGKWKSLLRIANGRSLRAIPIYLPNDPAIPAVGVPASSHFTRGFVREKKILQREAVGGPPGLATVAYLVLVAIVTGWIAAIIAGMRRMGGGGGPRGRRGRRPATAVRRPLGDVS